MKKFLTTIVALLLAVCACFTFTACGKTADNGSDLQNVIKNGKMVIGVTNFAPMDYKETGSDTWTGFDADFARAVCEKMGVTAEFVEIDWNNKENELNSKKIDCLWNGFTYTEKRAENIDFSKAYMKNKQVVVVKAENSSWTKDDLNKAGVEIAAEGSSAGADVIAENFANATFISTDAQTDALLEVDMGTVNAAVMDYIMALSYVGRGDYTDLHIIEDDAELTFAEEEYAIGFRKNSSLDETVNIIIAWLKAEGEIERIANTYSLANMLTNAVK